MSRKILAWILTGIISVLLIGGCSAGTGGQNGTDTDTDTEQTNEEAAADALPSEIRVGIACAGADEEYPTAFINKIKEYFVAAGVVEGRITQKRGASEEIAGFARELIGSGCSVLVIGSRMRLTRPALWCCILAPIREKRKPRAEREKN